MINQSIENSEKHDESFTNSERYSNCYRESKLSSNNDRKVTVDRRVFNKMLNLLKNVSNLENFPYFSERCDNGIQTEDYHEQNSQDSIYKELQEEIEIMKIDNENYKKNTHRVMSENNEFMEQNTKLNNKIEKLNLEKEAMKNSIELINVDLKEKEARIMNLERIS